MLPDIPKWQPVALDTETNGLYADDGARVSVVSLAWLDPVRLRGDLRETVEAVKTGRGVVSLALPFSQGIWTGRHGIKPGCEMDLFSDDDDNPNLGRNEWQRLLDWLRGRRLIFHNGKFDAEKMRYAPIGWDGHGIDLLDEWYWDTQVAAHDIWPGEPTGLKPTMARLWGENETAEAEALKPYLGPKTNPRFDLVPWPIIEKYAAKDAEGTIRLFYQEIAQLGLIGRDSGDDFAAVNEKLLAETREQIETAKSLYRMERAGIPYDAEGSREAARVLSKRKDALDLQLPFRATGPQAVQYFFTDGQTKDAHQKIHQGLNLSPVSLTEKGAPQFTEQVVSTLIGQHPAETDAGRVARLWAERNKIATAIKMWYVPYAEGLGSDGRLRCCFRQVTRGRGDVGGGTRSGRFSVERVNLQAIPHDYRLAKVMLNGEVPTPRQLIGRAIEALPEYDGWEFDLAQAELRLAAAWANCDRMLSAFEEGRDLHGETTTELFNTKPGDPDWGMYRQIGKRSNFTLCFGAGGATLATMIRKETGIDLSDDEGSVIVEKWNRLYPEFRKAIDLWSRHAEAFRSVPLASRLGFGTGRLRRFDHAEVRLGLHKAFNQLVQGSLGEFAKAWNLSTQAICDRHGLGFVPSVGWTGLVLVIHDSQVLLLPTGARGDAIAAEAVEACRVLWDEFFNRPDPEGRVSSVAGYSEGKRW